MIDKSNIRLWLLMGIFFTAACTVKLETAQLNSPGTTFTALDGTFKVGPGDGFPIPETTPYCYDNTVESVGSIFKAGTPIASQPQVGLKHGGTPVRIDITGEAKPFYGLLLFCSMPSSLIEQASLNRHEKIVVPENHRAKARSGQVTSILKIYKIETRLARYLRQYTWILWLADSPEKLN